MREIKNTPRSKVQIGFDGRVHKRFTGQFARERFDNEVRILRHLEREDCNFVPKLLHMDPDQLYLVTSNVGAIVQSISPSKLKALFEELKRYGVVHDDAFARNVTYSAKLGRFCVIDFEFATLKKSGEGLIQRDVLKI
ncbi:MAG: serine/threonine protein phosphatase [Verrucomicrobiota bacterium]|nr:serine/threonine protein phosphatase [Verrucomicrobiota bacterium]